MPRPTVDQLTRAIKISEQIQKLEAELASILGSTATTKPAATAKASSKKKRKKSKLSPEGLANIRAAQKKRWALKKNAGK